MVTGLKEGLYDCSQFCKSCSWSSLPLPFHRFLLRWLDAPKPFTQMLVKSFNQEENARNLAPLPTCRWTMRLLPEGNNHSSRIQGLRCRAWRFGFRACNVGGQFCPRPSQGWGSGLRCWIFTHGGCPIFLFPKTPLSPIPFPKNTPFAALSRTFRGLSPAAFS